MSVTEKLIAELTEAVRRQDEMRDSAFLSLPLNLCGFPCLNMTALHLAVMIHARSPFVCGGFPLPESVSQFLWALSPSFSYTDKAARDDFIRSTATLDFASACLEIAAYVDSVFMDAPPISAKSCESYNSWMAGLVDTIAREYGWGEHEILSLPMAIMFQYVRLIARRSGDRGPQFNKLTDAAKNRWLESVNSAKPETN